MLKKIVIENYLTESNASHKFFCHMNCLVEKYYKSIWFFA